MSDPASGTRQDLGTLGRGGEARVPPPQRSRLARVALPGALLVAFVLLLVWAGRDALVPRLDVRLVAVVVRAGEAGTGGGAAAVRASGWIEPDPYAIRVTALAEGVVETLSFLEGETVAEGQVVATLVADDARLAAGVAAASLDAARARERRAGAELARVESTFGAELARDVARAAASVRERTAELAAAEADVLAGNSTAEAESAVLARIETAFARGLASESERNEARKRVDAATHAARAIGARRDAAAARVAAAQAEADVLDVRVRAEVRPAGDGPTVAAARAAADEAIAERARAERDAEFAALRLRRMDVRAPRAGVVLERLATPGIRLGAQSPHGTDVATLYDPARLQVRVDVPLADAARIAPGQKARVSIEPLAGRAFVGVVTRVVPMADIARNTVQVKVRIESPDAAMRPEMLARVELMGPAADGAATPAAGAASARSVFAPERLVVRDGARSHVWLYADGRATRRDVTLGGGRVTDETGTWVEIAEGLRPGDDLIDAAGATLDEGRAVRDARAPR